jgi:hypothetical protein
MRPLEVFHIVVNRARVTSFPVYYETLPLSRQYSSRPTGNST